MYCTDNGRSADDTQPGRSDTAAAAGTAGSAAIHRYVLRPCTSDARPAAVVQHSPAAWPNAAHQQWSRGVAGGAEAGNCYYQRRCNADCCTNGCRCSPAGETEIRRTPVRSMAVWLSCRATMHMLWHNKYMTAHTHTRPLNGPLSGTTQVRRYQKGKTNLDFTGARDSEWQWHQLGRMQVCTSLQTDNHASTPPLSFYRPDALPATQPTASKH